MSAHIPSEAPPSYTDATASSPRPATLQVPQASAHRVRNGIPPEYRRSMEDEGRPLPQGWIRQYDDESHHQFFVDTTRSPPRSIWQHPYDDEDYMNTLDPQERARIKALHKTPSQADIEAESSADDEDYEAPHGAPPNYNAPTDHSHSGTATPDAPKQSFGRKMKDKLTGSTHEQREAARRERAIAEQQAYERHRKLREAMVKAIRTGEPQLVGKDRNGRDVYIEPPQQQGYNQFPGGYGYNPYRQGPYGYPNARYVRPAYPYGRPYGRGYGGGVGLPLAGGLMGGMILGGVLGAGF